MINESGLDRVLRLLVDLAILSLMVLGPRTNWGLLGLIPLLTGAIGTCPLYSLLGINTVRHKAL